jgi:hypothetical protein
MYGNRDYVVGITGLDYEPDETGFEFLHENNFFFSERPNRLLGPLKTPEWKSTFLPGGTADES